MAYTAGNLTLLSYGNGFGFYFYDAGSDTLATVRASGYFNNTDDDLNLAVGDVIQVKATNGFLNLRVDAVNASTGAVDTEAGAGEAQWLTVEIADVSTAGSVYIPAPFDGFIGRFKTVLGGAISGADASVGLEIGGTDVTGCQLTIANSGSAAGDVDEGEATANHAVSEGTAVEIDTDGGSTGTQKLFCAVEFLPA